MIQNIEILLAEDDKNLGTILKAYLEAKGCKTTLCVSGREALETFHSGKFNLCVLDVMMPQLDGFTVASGVHAKAYNPSIVSVPLKLEDKITVGIIRRSGIPPSSAADAFIAAVRRLIAAK